MELFFVKGDFLSLSVGSVFATQLAVRDEYAGELSPRSSAAVSRTARMTLS